MPGAIRALTVADIMSTQVLTVGPSASIAEAATLMMQRRVGSVLVVDGDRLLGIASLVGGAVRWALGNLWSA